MANEKEKMDAEMGLLTSNQAGPSAPFVLPIPNSSPDGDAGLKFPGTAAATYGWAAVNDPSPLPDQIQYVPSRLPTLDQACVNVPRSFKLTNKEGKQLNAAVVR